MTTTTKTKTKTHSSENNFNNVNSLSLRESLEYWVDVLKIKQDSELYRSIAAEVTSQTSVSLAMIKIHGNWITAMKLIADCSGMPSYNINNKHVFSQTQLYDFLALATRAIEVKGKVNNNKIILKIARDITENYYNFSDYLKSNYPGIIVDVISILHKGVDTNGSKVNPINIEKYYQLRRRQRIITGAEVKRPLTANTGVVADPIHQSEIILSLYSKKDFVESLHQITNRERNELQQSLTRLQDSDLKRISELCQNYDRLQYYSKLITKEGSQEQFKKEIETELGRKLNSTQLGRAINSIRRAQTYVENILDNKFIPDASHGINHVKHNLEYGYQLINLIECTRRKHKV